MTDEDPILDTQQAGKAEPGQGSGNPTAEQSLERDSSDSGPLTDDASTPTAVSSRFRTGEWEHEFSAHKIAVELRRIEAEIRQLLEERDPKRKRKFSGTRRWHELEEDLISLRFTGRIPEETLRTVQQLVTRRHFLFHQLRFVASTRATWNT